MDSLSAQIGVKHAQMQRLRKQIGDSAEHRTGKVGDPIWVWAPAWLRAWARLDAPAVMSQSTDDDAAYKRVRRQREEFRFAVERREYLHVDEVNRILDMAAAAVRSAVDVCKDRTFAGLLSERLRHAEEEAKRELGHVNGSARPAGRPRS
ncbi:MAG TPA: hypothetical protein PKC18_06345 [Lacipirellulaceae bacterium]|nr:hypothetical protein [Lacipirellulaceae bacterium]HMP08642.1 hypothetical protein [Lacipirellulaceae bacterium]